MQSEEVIRMKEELDCVYQKCDELNKELLRLESDSKKLSQNLALVEEELEKERHTNSFLEGKVEAYEFVVSGGGVHRG